MTITATAAGKPTIVLVHGAFAESASWNGVAARLLADGFPAVAVANPLRGVRTDADYLRSVLGGIEGPIVLVGHSYGGMVISNVATAGTGVTALVYVGAFAPVEGRARPIWRAASRAAAWVRRWPRSSCRTAAPTSTSSRTATTTSSPPTRRPTRRPSWR